MYPPSSVVAFKWTAAGTTSDAVPVGGFNKFNLDIPTGFVGVSVTFTASQTPGGTFRQLDDDAGLQVSVTVVANRSVSVTSSAGALALAAAGFIKAVSSASEAINTEVGLLKQV